MQTQGHRMNTMIRSFLAASALAMSATAAASAEVVTANPPRVIQAIPPGTAQPPGVPKNLGAHTDHAASGTIVAMSGNLLTVRLKTGRTIQVDASEAVRRGTYSAPFYIGKPILAEGSLGTGGVLYAIRVTRMIQPQQLPTDR
jgi:hypothetical protein